MKFARSFAMLASVAACQCALAQSMDAQPAKLRPFIGGGFTWGGDTLAPVTIVPRGTTTRYQEDISAGTGLDLRVGIEFQLTDKVSLQGALAYHNDQTNGDTGELSFHRVPIELLAHWRAAQTWRLGIGVRKGTHAVFDANVKTDASGNPLPIEKLRMSLSTGLVLEGERFLTPNWSFKARWVKETVKFEDAPDEKFKGDHFGLLTVYYFD